MPKFTQDLVETSTEHLNLKSIKHYMQVLERATKLERSSCLLEFEQKQLKEKNWRHRNRPFESIHLTSKLGRDIQSLLLKIFQVINLYLYFYNDFDYLMSFLFFFL